MSVFTAIRARWGLVALLLGIAGLAWCSTADRMAGMDAGPGTDTGALGWFLGAWVVFVAVLIALQKVMPQRRVATWVTAGVLVAPAIGMVAAPGSVTWLVVSGRSQPAMHAIGGMR